MGFWDNFTDLIWFFLWGFVFLAYLMTLFSIIGDLFGDADLSGIAKAVWLVFLLFLPFVTALAYLVLRGGGMAERRGQQVRASQAAADDYIRSVATSSPSEEIARAKALLDAGTITSDEYATLKAKALS